MNRDCFIYIIAIWFFTPHLPSPSNSFFLAATQPQVADMKAFIWLTVLQALAINAAPRHRRSYCTSSVATQYTYMTITPSVLSTVEIPPAQSTSNVGVILRSSNGVPFVPGSLAPPNEFTMPQGQVSSSTHNRASEIIVPSGNTQITEGGGTTTNNPSTSSTLPGGVFASESTSESTSTVTPSVPVITTSMSSGTAQILPPPSTQTPETQGTVHTSLDTTGLPTSAPILSTSIPAPSTTIVASESPEIAPSSVVGK